jgi:hypothetical protein
MSNDNSLRGRAILIVQRIWTIASALATEFEGKGAQAVLAKNSHPDWPTFPTLQPLSLAITAVTSASTFGREASLSSCTQGTQKSITTALRQPLFRSRRRPEK